MHHDIYYLTRVVFYNFDAKCLAFFVLSSCQINQRSEQHPQIVHFDSAGPVNLVLYTILKLLSRPVVCTIFRVWRQILVFLLALSIKATVDINVVLLCTQAFKIWHHGT
jgi:hypothetical protein